jgi:hypothetical protein
MKISLGNKILNIKFNIFKTPNYEKLKKELSDYFGQHDICGNKIKKFSLAKDFTNAIIPEEPTLEESLIGGNYQIDLKKIGEKYGINHLGFIHWCYHE